MTVPRVRVWDPLLRTCHWVLAAAVLAAWATGEGGGRWHEWLGYAALAAVLVRIPWGWLGPRHARFSRFVRSPAATLAYARQVLARSEPRHVGHNPLGAYMIVALLGLTALACGTGILYTTDAYWGVAWVEDLHEAVSTALLCLAGIHVAGVVYSSLRHRENLAASMLHGKKRAPGPGDIV